MSWMPPIINNESSLRLSDYKNGYVAIIIESQYYFALVELEDLNLAKLTKTLITLCKDRNLNLEVKP